MLSRTADNLYWLARYVERAEYLARILEVTQRLTTLPLAYVGSTNEWESAVLTAGCEHAFSEAYPEANEETVIDFLCFSADNPSSIRNCFEVARSNARDLEAVADRGGIVRREAQEVDHRLLVRLRVGFRERMLAAGGEDGGFPFVGRTDVGQRQRGETLGGFAG